MLSSDMTDTRGERVAWGPTALLDRAGSVFQQAPLNEEALLIADLPVLTQLRPPDAMRQTDDTPNPLYSGAT